MKDWVGPLLIVALVFGIIAGIVIFVLKMQSIADVEQTERIHICLLADGVPYLERGQIRCER